VNGLQAKKVVLIGTLLFSLIALWLAIDPIKYITSENNPNAIWEAWTDYDEDLKEIIDSNVIQRLKKVDQSGPPHYFGLRLPAFSRFEHSIGVLALLRKAGASKLEQIAGLLHDASHTAFSHLGDYLFEDNIARQEEKNYQDSIHLSYLRSHAGPLLKRLNIKIEDVDPDNGKCTMLEQPLPDMCADRIQYNIHTGLILKFISQKEARSILEDLQFKDGKWFFTDPILAKTFATLSVRFTKEFWGSKWNVIMNLYLSSAVKRAIKIGLITRDDVFSTDDAMLDKLLHTEDKFVVHYLRLCNNPDLVDEYASGETQKFTPKFRGINPLVKVGGRLVRLTEIDAEFKALFEEGQRFCKEGFNIPVMPSTNS
jgi:HD superfamily phosphohydrolase